MLHSGLLFWITGYIGYQYKVDQHFEIVKKISVGYWTNNRWSVYDL